LLRRTALIGALVALGVLVSAPVASASLVAPGTGSPSANRINDLYTITLVIGGVIFVGVWGALIYTLVRFRKRKGRVAAQIHGNTRLEIGWTVGAAAVLIALAVVTFVALNSIRNPPNSGPGGLNISDGVQYEVTGAAAPPNGRAVNIQVNGQQYIWRFTYLGFGKLADQLDDPYSYQTLYVPANTVVRLTVVSQDVVHSWWVPDLGGKVQAVPGYEGHTWFIAPVGRYTGQCAFLCGRGHARMTAVVVALPPQQWLSWIHTQQQLLAQADAAQKTARAKQKNKTGAAAVEVN